jgi:hypothetical protein
VLALVGLALACYLVAVATATVRVPWGIGAAKDEFPGNLWVQAFVRWDSGWYAQIAREGYSYAVGTQSSVAFFPAYPLSMRALSLTGLNTYVSGMLLSALCGVLGIVVFYHWAKAIKPEGSALAATSLLALYPFAFYLYGVVYSDSLFLLLATGAFLAVEKRALHWAILLGALATATRPIAPALVLGLLLRNRELRKAEGWSPSLLDGAPLLAASGFVAYCLFLRHQFGDAFAFATTQGSPGWDQAPGLRTWLKLPMWELFFNQPKWGVLLRHGTHALLTVGALALAWPARKLLGNAYAVYIAMAVGIPAVSTKDFMGLGRYAIAAFPVFLVASILLSKRAALALAVRVGSGLVLLALSAAYGAGVYLA